METISITVCGDGGTGTVLNPHFAHRDQSIKHSLTSKTKQKNR